MKSTSTFDIQGHRGARGLYPENTVTAFIEAVKLGVNTIELDVVISKDLQVVVSHEPWMNEVFCTRPDGIKIEKNSREKYNLFKMDYAEISGYDCGRLGNPEFPTQKALPEHKPLLNEVITGVEAFVFEKNLAAINYNIEIKSESSYDGIFNPGPQSFVDLVYNEIKGKNCFSRIYLQSFDVRILQEIKIKDPKIKLALLVENDDGLETNLQRLGFIPDIYSPAFHLLTDGFVKDLHAKKVRVIPWTVNEVADMEKLVAMGVDGIITDYPDRAIDLLRNW